jgi:UDP-2,3-diacylglucosamine pyrophosphatase LpxH
MTFRIALGLFLAAIAALPLAPYNAVRAQAAPGRTIVVIGDLHMGAGRDENGAWRAREDFRWAKELGEFLTAIDRAGRSAVDLVLNGDTFDLLSADLPDCPSADTAVGCAEPEALKRLEVVLTAHAAEIGALGGFSHRGTNRVVFVPGDHDAALLFPAVQRRLIAALNGAAGRVDVATAGHWTSKDGRVVAEHGHQIGPNGHGFSKWPAPVVRRGGRDHLEKPPAEVLVGPLYGRLEVSYSSVDNFATVGTGLKYALGAENAELGDLGAPMLRYLLLTMSWQQFRMELDDGEVKPPVWDLAAVRGQGAAFFVSALPDDDPFKQIATRALADGRLTSLQPLTDGELAALCNYRAAVRRARRRFEPFLSQLDPRGPVVAECPRMPESRGAVFDYFWQSRDDLFLKYIETLAGQPRPAAPPIAVLVHGHTHLPDRAQTTANMISGGLLKIPLEGFSPVRGALTPIAINGGAWQRTITPVQFERLALQRKITPKELLATLQPEDLLPCFSFVRLEPYTTTPSPAVRFWRQGPSGWEIAGSCQP